jgi:hypothetical protein
MAQTTNIEVGNDAEQAIMTQLMGDVVLRGLVAGQIYPSHLSELDQKDIAFPLVTFRQAGSGIADWQETIFPQVYQMTFWSQRSYNEAMRIRDAGRVALNNQRLTAGSVVILVKAQNMGQNVMDPTASLYYCAVQLRVYTLDVSTPS